MQKRHIITISGVLGSGKSTAAKRVSEALGYQHFSGGDFMRQMAAKRGVSLLELGVLAETDPAIDREIDRMQKEFMDTHDSFVIDSRLGWFWAEDSFKVFLSLDADTSATRVYNELAAKAANRVGESGTLPPTIDIMKERLAERLKTERARYQEYYGIADQFDHSHFDLVVDTKVNDIPTVEKIILEAYKAWLEAI